MEMLLLIGLGWYGIREPLKKKWKRDLIVFIVLYLLAASILVTRTAGIQLPYLMDMVEAFVKGALRLSID